MSNTRVFGWPFLENMTLRISFIVELFLSDTRITSGQPEKESTSLNKSPTQVMYTWSICTRLHCSTSLGHKCKVVCVKFLYSLHFLHLFIYFIKHLVNIPATMLLILFFFVCPLLHSIYHHGHFLSPIFFVFLEELSDPHHKSPYVQSLIYVLFLCMFFQPWNNFSICFFFLFSILSYFVQDHVLFSQPFYLKTKHQSRHNVKNVSLNSFSIVSFDSL